MGNSRESQNLFKSGSWKRFWYLIKTFNKYTYEDSFMPLICKIKGHLYYLPEPENEPNEWACKRCHNWVDAPKD
jgi:hypothetical protein